MLRRPPAAVQISQKKGSRSPAGKSLNNHEIADTNLENAPNDSENASNDIDHMK